MSRQKYQSTLVPQSLAGSLSGRVKPNEGQYFCLPEKRVTGDIDRSRKATCLNSLKLFLRNNCFNQFHSLPERQVTLATVSSNELKPLCNCYI